MAVVVVLMMILLKDSELPMGLTAAAAALVEPLL
jgi:hypothetical protein